MNRRTSLILIGLVLIASSGMAQMLSVLPDDRVITELEPTKLGEERFGALGIAAKITQNSVQRLVVKVFAKCPDGTNLLARGTRVDGKVFDLGSIEMLLDSGGLVLKSSTDPSGAFPLEELRSVAIYYNGAMLLNGVFER